MRRMPSCIAFLLIGWIFVMIEGSNAFVPPNSLTQRSHCRTSSFPLLRGGGGPDDNPINSGELVSTLAKIDQQWQMEQYQPNRGSVTNRWTKLILLDPTKESDSDSDSGGNGNGNEENPQQYQQPPQPQQEDFVYLLEPQTDPSCIIVFLGGAGLGQFPHIAYNELLLRVSNRLNAAIIAAPYTVGLDHFSIAKEAGEKLRKGIIQYQEDALAVQTTKRNLPIYCFGHSLGCKLQSIYMAATSQEFDGIGFLSFNNFSFSRTIGMARQFADQLRQGMNQNQQQQQQSNPSNGIPMGVLNQLFDLAETAVGVIGLDFSPNADDMRRLLQLKYLKEWIPKTRLFCFDDDTLDSSMDFVNSCSTSVSVSGLPGNHLTPVYLQLKVNDYMKDLPEEAQQIASQAMDGFQGVAFGNEEELNILVDEVCAFVMGKPPSRQPSKLTIPLIEGDMGATKSNV